MPHFHAVVWLDHTEAHVMHFAKDEVEMRSWTGSWASRP
jgi:hypothetical protein